MVAFTPVVQADFGNTPMGTAPAAWTDITRFARLRVSPIRVTRWRTDELSTVAPTTMRLLLDNADVPGDPTAPNAGRFTPGNSGSPWASGLVAGFRVRVGVTIGGTTYWRYDGYVDPLEAAFEDGVFPVASLSAQDWLAWAGQQPLRSMIAETILQSSTTPILYLPLTDEAAATAPEMLLAPAGATVRVQLVSNTVGTTGAVALAGGTTLPTEDVPGVLITAGAGNAPGLVRVTATTPYGGQGHAYLRINYTGTSVSVTLIQLADMAHISPSGKYPMLSIGIDTSAAFVGVRANDGTVTQITGVKVVNDGKPHDIVAEIISGGAINLYVDGVLDGTGGVVNLTTNFPATYTDLLIGGANDGNNGNSFIGASSGTFSHAAVYFLAGSINIADQYSAALNGFAGEGTGAHIARLLSLRANNGSVLDAGQGAIGMHRTAGVSLQQALLDTAKAEGGIVYVDGQGRVVFLGRQRLRNPSVAATLDIAAQQTTPDLTYRLDTQLLRNDVEISRDGGGKYRAQDTASQAGPAGVRPLSGTYLLPTDDAVKQAASFILANQKSAGTAAPDVAHDVLTEPTQAVAVAVLNLTPLQRISLTNPPTGAPTLDVITQGSTDSIGVDEFVVSFNTSKMPRQTLRFDAAADAFTKLDQGNVFAW